ncbi:cupin domain-containing protein [Candidatus Lokiarchaeum ossiferum]|uniref:cupin domain-containing protein n=1 Tax=Candidatus Lokiarchaeum ossiferum TaxID=2951803 RepID=UPI00352E4754
MEKVNLTQKFDLFSEYFSPKIVGELNNQAVKLVKFRGPFVWHHHETEDELFLVIKGEMSIEFREKTIFLQEGEFLVVPHGIEHRPNATEEVHVLVFEPLSTVNTGNKQNNFTVRCERI